MLSKKNIKKMDLKEVSVSEGDKRKIVYEIETEETVGNINELIKNINNEIDTYSTFITGLEKDLALLTNIKAEIDKE